MRAEGRDGLARTAPPERRDPDVGIVAGGRGAGAVAPLACESCHAPPPPLALFCPRCGGRLAAAAPGAAARSGEGPAFSAERRQVTLLFCDLVDSVALAAGQDPEDVADVMRRFHAALSETMARYSGRFERPTGDGGLFYFGHPAAAEDDCERAVRAALETIDCVARMPPQLGVRLQVRIGVSVGVVVVGDLLGGADRGGRDVIGDAANLGSRLQQAAAPGRVLVSDPVHRLTSAMFEWEDAGRTALRGWAEPIQVWRPLRPVAHADRFSARRIAGVTPLLGRAAELGALTEAWRRACDGEGGAALLTGEPGIGKSRLTYELTQAVIQAGGSARSWFCAPMQQEAALQPVIQQLAHDSGCAEADDAAVRRAKLRAALARVPGEDAELVADLVAPGPEPTAPDRGEISPGRRRERLLQALLACVLALADQAPLALAIEDAHWIDPTTAELAARLAEAAAGRKLLLVVTARPQFQPEWASRPGVRTIRLEPLDPDDGARLVRATSGGAALGPEVVADIVARSDGVPLHIEEVTRAVVEPGGADRDVPASIHASLLGRIDRLGPARAVAEVAAAIGRSFDLALLAAVCATGEEELSESVARLLASGLVVTPADGGGRAVLTFRHALIRDATYGTIVRRRRRTLHARVAEALERDFPADAAAQPQLVASHWAAAGVDRQAAAWQLRAGLLSLQRSAVAEAQVQLRRALALLEGLPDDVERKTLELEVLVVYGKSLIATHGHAAEVTRAAFARAKALCLVLGDPPQLLTVLFVDWTQAFFRGRLLEAEERATDLLARADGRDPVWRVMGLYVLGFTRLLIGDLRSSMALLSEGVERFEPDRRDDYAKPAIGDPRVIMRSHLGWGLLTSGAFGAARAQMAGAVEEARALGQPWALCLAISLEIHGHVVMHGAAGAGAMLDELERLTVGGAYHEAIARLERGWQIAAAGDAVEGLRVAREGRAMQAAIGSRLHLPVCLRYEAALLLGMGRADEALDSLEAGRRAQDETGEHMDDAEFHRVRGEALLALSRAPEAESELRAALRVSSERGQHLYALRAAISLARLLGSPARGILAEARGMVEDDPSVADVAAADALLGRLGGQA